MIIFNKLTGISTPSIASMAFLIVPVPVVGPVVRDLSIFFSKIWRKHNSIKCIKQTNQCNGVSSDFSKVRKIPSCLPVFLTSPSEDTAIKFVKLRFRSWKQLTVPAFFDSLHLENLWDNPKIENLADSTQWYAFPWPFEDATSQCWVIVSSLRPTNEIAIILPVAFLFSSIFSRFAARSLPTLFLSIITGCPKSVTPLILMLQQVYLSMVRSQW